MPRSLTWCCLLPVKWCRAVGNCASVTTRRSACIGGSRRRTEHFVPPRARISFTPGAVAKTSMMGSTAPVAAATMSMSPFVSAYRRTLPAISARTTPGAARTSASSFSAGERSCGLAGGGVFFVNAIQRLSGLKIGVSATPGIWNASPPGWSIRRNQMSPSAPGVLRAFVDALA